MIEKDENMSMHTITIRMKTKVHKRINDASKVKYDGVDCNIVLYP
jgi:hypothetical protein